MSINICICGGGGLGHVIAGVAAHKGFNVSILTRHPDQWNPSLLIEDCRGNTFSGSLACVTANPAEVIPHSDIVLLCLPGFAIEEELLHIQPFLQEKTCIGSVVSCTGFFFTAYRILGKTASLFGFQRAPFIARVQTYGQKALLLGYKKELQIATVNISKSDILLRTLQEMLDTPVRMLHHFLEASLTNSNPLLHPARLYSLFHTWSRGKTYHEIPGFYNSWDEESSELLIACDNEFQQILKALPVRIEPIPTLLEYYDSYDARSLTRKIRSIIAFKHIPAPMEKTEKGFLPDFKSRYFTEDFPFGLLIIKSIAEVLNICTPNIDKILLWGQDVLNKEYIHEGELKGKDLSETGYINADLFYKLLKNSCMDSELRKRFNPDGSLLRRQQLRMLELLEVIDVICRKHQIPYWLSSGTLIGAARHKGFIPWDDDLDIEMLRSDYLRLLKVLPQELPDNLALQTNETDPNYIFIYGKLRDKDSHLEETNSYDRIFHYTGIYIDIFPLEKIPYCLAWIGGHMQGQIYNQLNNKNIKESTLYKRIRRIYHFNTRIGFPILRFIAKLFPGKELRHSFGTAYFKPRYTDDIFPLTEMEFEGKMFPVPRQTDAVLRKIYGDYMQLPDLENIHPHYNKLEFYK